ncbi:MAG: hypothetical protein RIB67_09295 [Miltoncostaeaceae bacterium]
MDIPEPPSSVALSRPGAVIAAIERCMAARLTPDRSGWSAASHLSRDLERHFGVVAPGPAIEAALRVLASRRRVSLRADDDGALWYRLRG